MIGIYKVTSPTNKVYIGQSVDIEGRWVTYRKYDFHNGKLKNSIKSHGPENHTFEVLEECSVEELNLRERYYQDLYDVLGPNGLNLVLTTTSNKSGHISESSRIKMSNSQRELKKTLSKEHKERLLKVNLNKVHTKEHREKNSEGQRKFWTSEKRLEMSKNNPNSKMTESDIYNIRNSHLSQTRLAELYSVKHCTINNIINKKTWKHID